MGDHPGVERVALAGRFAEWKQTRHIFVSYPVKRRRCLGDTRVFKQRYVAETQKVVERCVLMATDPMILS